MGFHFLRYKAHGRFRTPRRCWIKDTVYLTVRPTSAIATLEVQYQPVDMPPEALYCHGV